MHLFRRLPVAAAALCASCLLALASIPAVAAPLTNDAFTRTATNGWGSTPQGQAYTTTGGSASDYSVASNRGQIKLVTVGNRLARLTLSPALLNVEGTVQIRLSSAPTASAAYACPALRIQTDGTSYYCFRLKHAVGGGVALTAQKLISGSQTSLGGDYAVGSGYTSGTAYTVRFSVAGANPTYLRAKAWLTSTPEPALWQIELTDSTASLQAAGGMGLRAGAQTGFTPLNASYLFDDFQIHNVAYVADLKTAMAAAVAGDILYFTGTHTYTGINPSRAKTANHGTASAPIIVRGVNATIHATSRTSGYGLEIAHNHWRFDDFTINNAFTGLYCIDADYGVLSHIDITNIVTTAFKFRRNSNFWEVVGCSVNGTGQNATGDLGEGFYIGDANSNWSTPTTPDTTGNITLRDCYAVNTTNDAYDIKEGAHHVKLINCVADFTGIEPPANATYGDSGFYLRGDDLQLIGCSVVGLGNGGTAYNANNALLNGIDYGNRIEFKAVSATDVTSGGAMFEIHTRCDDVEIYTDYTATNVANFKVGAGSYTSPAPASFVELVW